MEECKRFSKRQKKAPTGTTPTPFPTTAEVKVEVKEEEEEEEELPELEEIEEQITNEKDVKAIKTIEEKTGIKESGTLATVEEVTKEFGAPMEGITNFISEFPGLLIASQRVNNKGEIARTLAVTACIGMMMTQEELESVQVTWDTKGKTEEYNKFKEGMESGITHVKKERPP